jgi:hypothetical protein
MPHQGAELLHWDCQASPAHALDKSSTRVKTIKGLVVGAHVEQWEVSAMIPCTSTPSVGSRDCL